MSDLVKLFLDLSRLSSDTVNRAVASHVEELECAFDRIIELEERARERSEEVQWAYFDCAEIARMALQGRNR